ncbi:MAG: carboxynorspermidine decarboxylase [Clostridiales bacterium]|nr:carboxynorspermidine decarboxylase [Clostridiales bacterium]
MNFYDLPTPCYVIDEKKLINNLEILRGVQNNTGCKILLAQKAFSAYWLYPLIGQYLCGTTASGLYEAKLGREYMGKETHIFSPAYKEKDFDEICGICEHIVFNSFSQLEKYKSKCKSRGISIGIRLNPEFSTQSGHEIYDPCAPGSRLGVTAENFREDLLEDIDGFHFHTLCEQNSDDLIATFKAVEEKFGKYLSGAKWINFGGGHHITRKDYDVNALEELIKYARDKYNVTVYLEPGEAVALNAGYLVTEVLEKVHNKIDILILDASAACHMPDVLEMPYRPPLKESGKKGEKKYDYRLSSCTCLAGDIIGDYSFDKEIVIGDRLVFEDMAIYSMVKNNTFNGMPLPAIALMRTNGECEIIKEFGYEDFKSRL